MYSPIPSSRRGPPLRGLVGRSGTLPLCARVSLALSIGITAVCCHESSSEGEKSTELVSSAAQPLGDATDNAPGFGDPAPSRPEDEADPNESAEQETPDSSRVSDEGTGNGPMVSCTPGGPLCPQLIERGRASIHEILAHEGLASDSLIEELVSQYVSRIRELPAELALDRARELKGVAAGRDSARRGEGVGLLGALSRSELSLDDEVLSDWSAVVNASTLRRTSGPVISGGTLRDRMLAKGRAGDELEELEDGTTLEFGPGIHVLGGPDFNRKSFPKDVALVGQGKDATLLQLRASLPMRGDVERLRISQMTIDTGGRGLFDLRSGALVLELEDVRIVGFDGGNGGSFLFSAAAGTMVRATRCDFLGGYGRTTGQGSLFRETGDSVALGQFDHCSFEVHRLGLGEGHAVRRRVVFSNCYFASMLQHMNEPIPGLELRDCRFGEEYDPRRRESYRRDLSDLFPGAR